ncbi:MAG: transketolase [Planctomycetota bacterium]|nr:MAG: transketolase [Planctomycetota bacterium]
MIRVDLHTQEVFPVEEFYPLRRKCAAHIVEMTYLAGCGHPGGSLSTLDFLLVALSCMRHDPKRPGWRERDRLFISHGHISPGVYSALGAYGYFSLEEAVVQFRKANSPFGGHVEWSVPGVEWNTGNLGQGLSAAVASALAGRIHKLEFRTVVCMGDGEQQKGQISEAARFARKYRLNNLVAFVDVNGLQIGGETEKIMPLNLPSLWQAFGWNVLELEDGHHPQHLYKAFRQAYLHQTPTPEAPTVILAKTIMGKGVSFMENQAKFHGTAPSKEQAIQALQELNQPNRLETLETNRKELGTLPLSLHKDHTFLEPPQIEVGAPMLYPAQTLTDCRSAYGRALEDLAKRNNREKIKIVGFTCDLEGSVKMNAFHKTSLEAFFEGGIQEHNTAALAGRLSKEGLVVFFSTFGVFAGSEVYNQQRLNDFNRTNLKVVATHCGLDVGEDGPTHQCIDFIGLFSNLFSFSIFFPADPNQCDHIIRYIAGHKGNFFVGMGRSKLPIVLKENGEPYFDLDYRFQPGKADRLRNGDEGAILAFGPVVHQAIQARERLLEKGKKIQVLNFASLKPIDEAAVREAAKTGAILVVEDHHVETGLGAKVAQILGKSGLSCKLQCLGVNHYGSSGKPKELYKTFGLDSEGIFQAWQKFF